MNNLILIVYPDISVYSYLFGFSVFVCVSIKNVVLHACDVGVKIIDLSVVCMLEFDDKF